jgi:hypothetical protein
MWEEEDESMGDMPRLEPTEPLRSPAELDQ